MAHLTATKLGGFFADLLSIQELIMMRPSALSSSYYCLGGTHISTISLLSHSTAGYDVKNAFLHGTLTETVYCVQPSGFVDSSRPDHVCRLNKSHYGLKQAPRCWHSRFASHITSLDFVEAKSDTSLFISYWGADMAFLLLYVDDIVLTASSTSFL